MGRRVRGVASSTASGSLELADWGEQDRTSAAKAGLRLQLLPHGLSRALTRLAERWEGIKQPPLQRQCSRSKNSRPVRTGTKGRCRSSHLAGGQTSVPFNEEEIWQSKLR